MMYIKRNLSICDKYFAVLDHMTSHDPDFTSYDRNWLATIIIAKKMSYQIKLKTSVLQSKYVQASLKSNDWPQVYLYRPPKISTLFSILEHIQCVHQILCFFPRFLESLPPLPRQHSAAIGCTKPANRNDCTLVLRLRALKVSYSDVGEREGL